MYHYAIRSPECPNVTTGSVSNCQHLRARTDVPDLLCYGVFFELIGQMAPGAEVRTILSRSVLQDVCSRSRPELRTASHSTT